MRTLRSFALKPATDPPSSLLYLVKILYENTVLSSSLIMIKLNQSLNEVLKT